jgi:hypothetical protein
MRICENEKGFRARPTTLALPLAQRPFSLLQLAHLPPLIINDHRQVHRSSPRSDSFRHCLVFSTRPLYSRLYTVYQSSSTIGCIILAGPLPLPLPIRGGGEKTLALSKIDCILYFLEINVPNLFRKELAKDLSRQLQVLRVTTA